MVFGIVKSLFGQVSAAQNVQNAPINTKLAMSKGWGVKYQWMNLPDGLALANKQQKPVMVVIHSMNCSSCIRLKRRFARSDKMLKMSEKFILVNLETFETPQEQAFAPDGHYVPRVLFFSPTGVLLKDVANEFREELKFTYSDPAFMVDAMTTAASYFKGSRNRL